MILFAMIASNCRASGKPDGLALSASAQAATAAVSVTTTAPRSFRQAQPTVILMRQGDWGPVGPV